MLATAASVEAQTPRSDEPVCFGFSFGSWTPALNWHAAGHDALPDSSKLQHAPRGRDWASDLSTGPLDSVLVLFPAWWPVGVGIALPTRRLLPGDTVTGQATAFTSDARLTPPKSRVRAWRVACATPSGYLEPSTNWFPSGFLKIAELPQSAVVGAGPRTGGANLNRRWGSASAGAGSVQSRCRSSRAPRRSRSRGPRDADRSSSCRPCPPR